MAIINLDHTIVPAKDNEESARFFARIMGLQYEGPHGHFAREDFDAIVERVKGEGLAYGSDPRAQDNMQINTRRGGRGFYFKDPNGHSLELLTQR